MVRLFETMLKAYSIIRNLTLNQGPIRMKALLFVSVDTCGGTQRQNPQAHGYRSSFHPEYYRVSYPRENMCVLSNKFV
jgi:hypothetical protein